MLDTKFYLKKTHPRNSQNIRNTFRRRGHKIKCNMRRCQIKVQFECKAKTKFLAALFQPITSISDYQSVPWSPSFQNMYNTHMYKMYLKVEK